MTKNAVIDDRKTSQRPLDRMKSVTFRADATLLLAAAIWGTGFVAQRAGMAHVGPMTFTSLRLAIGALVLVPLIWIRRSGTSHREFIGCALMLAAVLVPQIRLLRARGYETGSFELQMSK